MPIEIDELEFRKADGVDGSRSRHLKCQSVVVIETITSNRSHPL